MLDGSWVTIKRGNHTILGWIEKNKSFHCKDPLYQTYYFHTLHPERSKAPILIYYKDIHKAELTLEDEDYHAMQLLALELKDANWFSEIGERRKEIPF
ncbi:hypothetical protein [Shouchella clausii]|jgi:hypothetical protein|uniref:hypothetical protein n=1 Tax=Shouchella clausii TaxID=79880 RepID=UPI000B9702D4|nr:hypothetical protein [Shouchella clausii]AST97771.1 hypothetical protein BC8716_18135 [Shouchella clausii]MCR1289824.1 hypothetical protein [Shouchella clausii]MEB5474220.1 hypothetical protein [Shouchella clausii]QNM44210.1 hypothetical protein DUT88_15445 [Shouchella clausii]WQG97101.1 hypothetical protein SR921_10380 [Shouchella clausii]